MLSRVFNQRTLFLLTILFVPLSIGCASKTVELNISQEHPANPNAQQGVSADPHSMPMTEVHKGKTPMAEMHKEEAGHSSIKLSANGTEALGAMLDAYLAIGDQLASDTMDDVNAKAHALIKAFHIVESEAPDELWSAHDVHTKMIHDTAHQLGELSDIKAARIAYGSLSDSFRHLITVVGVPANYEEPVYSYVCGMAPDVPEAGIWLQTSESVRNPYFGSAMLRCHTSKTQMPASSADMSGAKDMESHKHSH